MKGQNKQTLNTFKKRTHQGNRTTCKMGSMNKSRKRSFKPYRGQGK